MDSSGIRVLPRPHYRAAIFWSAVLGLAAGSFMLGSNSASVSIVPLAILLLAPILWSRTDQHAYLMPLRVATCASFAYIGPMLIVLTSLGSLSTPAIIPGLVLATVVLFSAGFGWGALVRALFRSLFYEVVVASEGCCPTCGYDLRENQSSRCPECGTTTERTTRVRTIDPLFQRVVRWTALVIFTFFLGAFFISWVAPFTEQFDRGDYSWTVKLKHGGIDAFRWDSSLAGFDSTSDIFGAAILPRLEKTTVGSTQVMDISIPFWMPLAAALFLIMRTWPRRPRPVPATNAATVPRN